MPHEGAMQSSPPQHNNVQQCSPIECNTQQCNAHTVHQCNAIISTVKQCSTMFANKCCLLHSAQILSKLRCSALYPTKCRCCFVHKINCSPYTVQNAPGECFNNVALMLQCTKCTKCTGCMFNQHGARGAATVLLEPANNTAPSPRSWR